MKEKVYNIRAYSKKELGVAYAPDLTPRSAERRLMTWLKFNPQLMDALFNSGYYPSQKIFTPQQVGVIFQYLGEP